MPADTTDTLVIEDDPTGTQLLERARVYVDPDPALLRSAAGEAAVRSLHLLTNSRAMEPDAAYSTVRAAVETCAAALSGARILLRGDSTLRAHLVEEYRAYCDGIHAGAAVPLLLVPALPSAGRITVAGEHRLLRGGSSVPIGTTEYAQDPSLGFRCSRLLDWAQERSAGLFRADDGLEVPLDEVRAGGGGTKIVAAVRRVAASGRPGVIVPDAAEAGDLEVIAGAIRACDREGVPLAVRCAPALVGILAGNVAAGPPTATFADGTLVLAGSFVPLSTRQLGELDRAHPGSTVVVEPLDLCAGSGEEEVARIAATAGEIIERSGVAIVATSRRPDAGLGPAERELLARRLAAVVAAIPADTVVAKGGVTSAVTFVEGLGASSAEVVGPLVPGVSLWRPLDGPRAGSAYLVVPGNVGGDRLLVDVVDAILNHRRSMNV